MAAAFSDKEKAEALADILGEALDEADLYDLEDRLQWSEVVSVIGQYLNDIVIHHWRNEPPALFIGGPVEPWIVRALEVAMIGRGLGGEDVAVKLTVIQ